MESIFKELKDLTTDYKGTQINNYSGYYEVRLRDEENETATYKINGLESEIIPRVKQVISMFFNN